MKQPIHFEVVIEKLVHGGQGIGTLEDGRKAFVWGALPGERVTFELTKKKSSWCEGVATEVLTKSPYRIEPREANVYTATSPWQILEYQKEAEYKQTILTEAFEREHVAISWQEFYQDSHEFGYRNKMEYNFWYFKDTEKVSLALHKRSSHQKIAIEGSALASKAINSAGAALVAYINNCNIEARPIKSVILRSDATGKVGMTLFLNDPAVVTEFSSFTHPNTLFEIVFSNPKSPASVTTQVLVPAQEALRDKLLGREFAYSARSFFQVNIPVYEIALGEIARVVQDSNQMKVLDMYSGVGSIGLSIVGDDQRLTMIEISEESTDQAKLNMIGRKNCEVITSNVESSLEYFAYDQVVILDPPRAGLHSDVSQRLCEVKPPVIIYLSCNPSTQARDVKILIDVGYKISHARGYNFFPRTPHIESLIVLNRV